MRILWRLTFALVGAALVMEAGPAHAQLYSTDPYDPAGRPFRAYVYPGAGEVYGGMGGTPRSSGSYSPNQFDRADDDLGFPSSRSRSNSAYRNLDREYGREYVPNERADQKYFADRQKREREMMKATLERDPKKRDRMVREAEQDAKKSAGDVGLSVRRSNSSGGSKVPAVPIRRSTTTSASRNSAAPDNSAIPATPTRRSRSDGPVSAPERNRKPTGTTDTTIPPAPSTRRQPGDTGGSTRAPEPRPSDVLERSRNMDRQRPQNISPRRLPNTP